MKRRFDDDDGADVIGSAYAGIALFAAAVAIVAGGVWLIITAAGLIAKAAGFVASLALAALGLLAVLEGATREDLSRRAGLLHIAAGIAFVALAYWANFGFARPF